MSAIYRQLPVGILSPRLLIIILGGGIGIFVDAASGAAQKYPDKIVLWMKPKQFSSPAAKRAWEADYAKYEREIADAIAAKKAREKRTQNN